LLAGLGYVEVKARKVLVCVRDDYVRRLLVSKVRYRPLYDITVMQSIPFKFHDPIKSEPYYVPSDASVEPIEIDDAWNSIRDVGYITSDSDSDGSID